jgi:N6-L-threonylcarbamoyladenine synthase
MTVLGIDTSCYTTSVASVGPDGVLQDLRKLLKAPKGSRGLQQSAALFQHVQQLPDLLEQLNHDDEPLSAVAVSTRPRPVQGSYMPVFTAGHNFARVVSTLLHIPLFETSHQEGHIAAGCHSCGRDVAGAFLVFHLSGGTTELLQARQCGAGFDLQVVGCGLDVHAGQFIDRVGVALGLSFPAGPSLEQLAKTCASPQDLGIKAHIKGADCNLSGAEAAAQRQIARGADPAAVAYAVQSCLADAFAKMTIEASAMTGLKQALFIGGVASNTYLRQELEQKLNERGITALFAFPRLSSDNAVGVALLGYQFFRE